MVGKIVGTGSYRPVQIWDNEKLSHMMDTSDEWIRGRTGIGQRHIATGQETVSWMAAQAAKDALANAGMEAEEIDPSPGIHHVRRKHYAMHCVPGSGADRGGKCYLL